ncbi:MAG TPA: LacI family DNA-binding transcriptional regulator [Phycisphaerae bacterium]|nr:LacI family DNA-binding transcriptional regulator [Phycisphaerae bacterium]HOJ73417.1 LacI family DNA-binding transcriptional regulator [Phycisphaerae bacterium]HOM51026.1 LacI family DNA-binding transcriptional regulator [Phycisphaerae bacterium]HON65897.1 LacI family DNA-binding transcriptional regulator [Phycisphaerae bacterium]HOQ85199.1 LacI family DNA-binding transcriptional regulator [Phycisphaerae bacterium]
MSHAKPKARVTLKTVAEKAGVSVATVSLILSGRDEWLRQFHPDTIARVQQCAKRLGYRANLFATGLPMKTSSFFSLVLADMGEKDLGTWHHWAFEGSLLAGVVAAALEKRLYPVVATSHRDTDASGVKQISKIINGGVFGSIARSPNPELEKFLRGKLKQGHPLVVVFPGKLQVWPTNAIDVDNYQVGRKAGEILLHRGRKHWFVARYQKMSEAHRLRLDGFTDFARQAGIPVHQLPLTMDVNELRAQNQILAELDHVKADGLFALDCVASVGSVMACVESGRRVAEDVDVLGCDCSLSQTGNMPTITSVDISWREVGELSVQRLVEMCDASASTFDTILLPPRVLSGVTCPVPAHLQSPSSIEGLGSARHDSSD